jgi:FMN phosphatase YigB (HAD superfamily)
VVISNATYRDADAYRRDLVSFSLDHFVGAILSSADLGYRKPHKLFFVTAAVQAGVFPEDCVVIGDSEEKDILPPSQLGMRTIRVAIEAAPASNSVADVLVTSLHEAAEALRILSQR